jgi:hypothetical protein
MKPEASIIKWTCYLFASSSQHNGVPQCFPEKICVVYADQNPDAESIIQSLIVAKETIWVR